MMCFVVYCPQITQMVEWRTYSKKVSGVVCFVGYCPQITQLVECRTYSKKISGSVTELVHSLISSIPSLLGYRILYIRFHRKLRECNIFFFSSNHVDLFFKYFLKREREREKWRKGGSKGYNRVLTLFSALSYARCPSLFFVLFI